MLAVIGGLGSWEILAILVIALLIFGPRLPKVMRAIGKSMSEFKKGIDDVEDSVEDVKNSSTGRKKNIEPPQDKEEDES